jgi:aminopeptidase YwaD
MASKYTNLEVIPGHIYDSDYMPFEALGYVVAGLYDGGQFNRYYHTQQDEPSKLNIDYIVSVTKLVLAAILSEAKRC